MSTRSNIAIKVEGGYLQAYVHYDGMPEDILVQLKAFHNTPEKALDIVNRGDIKSVNEDGTVDVFDDAGDATLLPNPSKDEEFLYVFQDGEWNEVDAEEDAI